MRTSRQVFFILVLTFAICDIVRGQRVGFQFSGQLRVSGPGNITLFDVSVPKTAAVTGTFSYDSDTLGVDGGAGVETYHQLINGGYTMNINNGAIQLSASDYNITITNDSGSPSLDSLIVGYLYDSTVNPPITPQAIVVNGAAWTGSKAEIYMQERWDSTAFPDASLTPNRPISPGAILPDSQCLCADVRSLGAAGFFSLTSITAIPAMAGDYNRDSKFDISDYNEWRNAFDQSDQHYRYADGNYDGVVNAADYVAWRMGLSAMGAELVHTLALPEPPAIILIGFGAGLLASFRRHCHKGFF